MDIFEQLRWFADKVIDDNVYKEVTLRLLAIENEVKEHREKKAELENQLLAILREVPMSDSYFVLLVSGMLAIFERAEYAQMLLEGVLISEEFSLQNMDYVWRNMENFLFKHPECESSEVKDAMIRLQGHIYTELRKQVVISKKGKEQRNSNKVVVLAGTFLGERHAPTHSALERCVALEEQMGVEVYIVAAKEGPLAEDSIPYYKRGNLNTVPEYEGFHIWPYRNHEFKLYQEAEATNTPVGIQKIIDIITQINPYYVVYVGTESYIADIVNEFCPVVAVSVVFSKLRNFHTTFAMVGRNVTEEERKIYPYEILEVPFSFELREKEKNYTREELGIPEEEFVLAVVGLRLDYDVTEEFLEHLEQIDGIFVLFIGCFNSYTEKISRYAKLNNHSKCTGMISDVVGVLECADLYVNPRRMGGGFSVIEGFHAGIPAVSIHYGDVAAAAGEEFCVENYSEMQKIIERYQTDYEFYSKMLAKGKAREEVMTNGAALFCAGIEKMLNSPRFY